MSIVKKYLKQGHPTLFVLDICKVFKSTWYDHLKIKQPKVDQKSKGRPIPGYSMNPNGTLVEDSEVVKHLINYRNKKEFGNAGGYHKLKFYLQRDYGVYVNHKKLYRLCKENKLLLPKNKKKINKNKKICLNKEITGPNQLWEFDIKYGYIHGENRHFYILAFIDVFTRKVVSYHIGLACKAIHLKNTFEQALRKENIKPDSSLVIRSDNGPQMTSNMFKKYIDDLSMDHEFIPPGDCNKNAHIESFNSILEIEFLQVRYFKDFKDAYQQTVEFIYFYNNKRIHGSLKMKTPLEFIVEFNKGTVTIDNVRV